MKVFQNKQQWQELRSQWGSEARIGFIPTMGCLHAGHLSLVTYACARCDYVVVSLFVNPTQFNEASDYTHYPRPLSCDLEKLQATGVDCVWTPEQDDVYPQGDIFSIQPTHASAQCYEGEHRPGHFAGMLTVVMKLLQWIGPTYAFFGEKDYQQCELVRSMVENFFVPVEIVRCPIFREASGLPYSSRHVRLTTRGRRLAEESCHLLHQVTPENKAHIVEQLKQKDVIVDYIAFDDDRVLTAVRIDNVRLLDHFVQGEFVC